MCPSASQLAVCIVISLPWKPCTRHGKKPHSFSFELTFSSNCCLQFLHSQFRIAINDKKVTIDVDDLLDGLTIAVIASELHAEDYATNTPKIKFSANKIIAERFFDNPSDYVRDHHSKVLFVGLRFTKCNCLNCG